MEELVLSTLRLSVPVTFAALGGMFSERSGTANIALESNLLLSAFLAAASAHFFGNIPFACFLAVSGSILLSLCLGGICIFGRADQIVVGMAANLGIAGLIPVLNKSWFGNTGSTPQLGSESLLTSGGIFFVLALFVVSGSVFLFRRTLFGLRLSAVGEQPLALQTQGLSIIFYRFSGLILCGAIAGMGGVSLSLWQSSGYVRDMSGGRVYIALAALIFGGWRPLPTLGACLFFSLLDAIQIQLQGKEIAGILFPSQLMQTLPYLLTLVVLVAFPRRISAPRALNTDQAAHSL